MSQFLPTNVPQRAGSDLAQQIISRDPSLPLQQDERQLLNRLLSEPTALPQAFWAALIDRMIVELPSQLPISQMQGFSQFTGTSTTVLSAESTSSTSFENLTTVGPSISGLSDGQYILSFGAVHNPSAAGFNALMGMMLNSTEAADEDSVFWNLAANAIFIPGSRSIVKTLNGGGNNTVTARYRVTAGTGTFRYRWLVVQRIGNV